MDGAPPLSQGTDRCRCCACGLSFTSSFAFDKHRVGSFAVELQGTPQGRRCLTIAEMKRRGMARVGPGYWASTGRRPPSTYGAGLASPPAAGPPIVPGGAGAAPSTLPPARRRP